MRAERETERETETETETERDRDRDRQRDRQQTDRQDRQTDRQRQRQRGGENAKFVWAYFYAVYECKRNPFLLPTHLHIPLTRKHYMVAAHTHAHTHTQIHTHTLSHTHKHTHDTHTHSRDAQQHTSWKLWSQREFDRFYYATQLHQKDHTTRTESQSREYAMGEPERRSDRQTDRSDESKTDSTI